MEGASARNKAGRCGHRPLRGGALRRPWRSPAGGYKGRPYRCRPMDSECPNWGQERPPWGVGPYARGMPASTHHGVGATLVVAPTGVGRWTVNVPMGGKRGRPGASAPTKKGAANRRIAAGTALKMKVKYKYIARLFDKSLRASACSPPRPLPPLTAHRSTVPIHP